MTSHGFYFIAPLEEFNAGFAKDILWQVDVVFLRFRMIIGTDRDVKGNPLFYLACPIIFGTTIHIYCKSNYFDCLLLAQTTVSALKTV